MTKRLLALTLTVLLALVLFCSCTENDLNTTEPFETEPFLQNENPEETDSGLAWAKEMTYTYFYPSENGSITSTTYTEQLDEGKTSETMQTHMDRFFGFCGIKGIAVVSSKVEGNDVTETKDYGGETIVVHTPGEKTLVLTLEGDAELSETVKECLIKTLEELSYCKYFKVSYNEEFIHISGAIAER